MRSKLSNPSLLLFLSILITACSGSTSPTLIPPTLGASPLPAKAQIPSMSVCTPATVKPTPGPDAPSLFPSITSSDHSLGSDNALVTLLDYSDYQDIHSADLAKITKQLYDENPKVVRLVTRNFPIYLVNDKAAYAGLAAEAAALQNKFWEMHDLLFEQQTNWIYLSPEEFYKWVSDQAVALGMDRAQFQSDMKRQDVIDTVNKSWEAGTKIKLPGTPVLLINGEIYSGPQDYDSLNTVVQLIKLGEHQYTDCPPITVDTTRQYIATLHTAKGDVTIQLFADKAPYTVNSFIFLAKNGWYNNITFHRVIPDLFAQTGDPSGTGKGNPGYYLITEITPSLKFDKPGMVAMVNSGPDSSGSQFFITYVPTSQYNGKYTIFGQVLTGMDVLKSLTPRDPQPGTLLPPGDKLISVEIKAQ